MRHHFATKIANRDITVNTGKAAIWLTIDDMGVPHTVALTPDDAVELGAALIVQGETFVADCDHNWVDARNSMVTSGEWCTKCNAVREGNQ